VMPLVKDLPLILSKREALTEQYKKALTLDVDDPDTPDKAKELRLRLRDIRTKGIEPWHKDAKKLFLAGGRFVDAIKNQEVEVNKRMEDDLLQIEKYHEIQEEKRRDKIRQEREALLEPYQEVLGDSELDYALMDDDIWESYFKTIKEKFQEAKKQKELDVLELQRERKYLPLKMFDTEERDLRNMDETQFEELISNLVSDKAHHDEKLKRAEEIEAQEKARVKNELIEKLKYAQKSDKEKLSEYLTECKNNLQQIKFGSDEFKTYKRAIIDTFDEILGELK
jgi:hypothetical protein